jgi:hypothetical protein
MGLWRKKKEDIKAQVDENQRTLEVLERVYRSSAQTPMVPVPPSKPSRPLLTGKVYNNASTPLTAGPPMIPGAPPGCPPLPSTLYFVVATQQTASIMEPRKCVVHVDSTSVQAHKWIKEHGEDALQDDVILMVMSYADMGVAAAKVELARMAYEYQLYIQEWYKTYPITEGLTDG